MSKVCNKQFITLSHREIRSHFTHSLYVHSPSAHDTDATCERNSSYFKLTCVVSILYFDKSFLHTYFYDGELLKNNNKNNNIFLCQTYPERVTQYCAALIN